MVRFRCRLTKYNVVGCKMPIVQKGLFPLNLKPWIDFNIAFYSRTRPLYETQSGDLLISILEDTNAQKQKVVSSVKFEPVKRFSLTASEANRVLNATLKKMKLLTSLDD